MLDASIISNVVRRFKSNSKDDDYIPFGPVARGRLKNQAQYARHWLKDPEVGRGIRWRGDFSNYHSLEIHRDDVGELERRVEEEEKRRGVR